MQNKTIINALKISITLSLIICFCSCQNPQNFDSLTPPELPAGWVSSGVDGQKWITVADTEVDRPADTAPNSAFVPAFNNQNVTLTLPIIILSNGGSSEISFKHRCKTENLFDGMILELSVAGAPHVNVKSVGTIIEGDYSTLLVPVAGISEAWTGEVNYVTTRVSLPNFAAGTTLDFRFRTVSDSSISLTGCSLDSMNFKGADLLVTTTDNKDPAIINEEIVYTVTVKNLGPLPAAAVQLTDILPANFVLSSVSLSQGSLVVSTAPVLSANVGNLAVDATAVMTIKGKIANIPEQAALVQLSNGSKELLRNIAAAGALFGPALQATATAPNYVIANDGSGSPEEACQTFPAGNVPTGAAVLIRQSANCSFNQQVKNAELAGAVAAIIYNSSDDQLTSMASTGIPVSIPSVFIGASDGQYLRSLPLSSLLPISLIGVPNSISNEAIAKSSVFESDYTNSFSLELTGVTAPDSDGDGVIDTLDLCPGNIIKTSPGACGCALQDLDTNSNGTPDCLPAADLKSQAKKLQQELSALKILNSKATAKQKAAQSLAKKNLKSTLASLTKIVKNSGAGISLLNNKTTLKAHAALIKSSVALALQLKTSLAKDKKNAAKNIKALLKALGN